MLDDAKYHETEREWKTEAKGGDLRNDDDQKNI